MWTHLIALDIETDTSDLTPAEVAAGYVGRGLDPDISPITAIAVARQGHDPEVLTGAEAAMLTDLDALMRSTPPGVLVTWNGSVFDLPFLFDRARRVGVPLGLAMAADPAIVPKHDSTPGHDGGYQAAWASAHADVPHAHLDIAYALRGYSWRFGIPWALKPVARSAGLDPVEVDRTAMHELSDDELRRYVASDAQITLELARLVLGGAFSTDDRSG